MISDVARVRTHDQRDPRFHVNELMTNVTSIVVTHIAKTGGGSTGLDISNLAYELQQASIGKHPVLSLSHRQRCHASGMHSHPGAIGVVFLREPRQHCRSQFFECRNTSWGRSVALTRRHGFPRTDDSMGDFSTWLAHFARTPPAHVGPRADFNCLDPRDMATRQLSCNLTAQQERTLAAGNDATNHALPTPPSLAQAVGVVESVDFLGITEFYEASWCMLAHRLTGRLRRGCACDERALLNSSHYTHGLVAEAEARYAELAPAIDRLTRLDAQLYQVGLARFWRDVAAFEYSHDVRILPCQGDQELVRGSAQRNND